MSWKLVVAVVAGLILGQTIPFLARQQEVLGQPQKKTESWEYRVVRFSDDESEAEKELTRLGDGGWVYAGLLTTSTATPPVIGVNGTGQPAVFRPSLVAFKRLKQ